MPVARPESSGTRVIAHVDMDCFYVQVEQRKEPSLRGHPTAVIQYNAWKGGALIAVSYEARAGGVNRFMRGDEAKQACPQIHLVQVPVARGKADLSTYRNAGSEVVSILARKGRCERASIDEVYLDLTDAAETMLAETPPENLEAIDEESLKSHVLGLDADGNDMKDHVKEWLQRTDADHRDKLLACGALIVSELRLQVLKETEFTCSAGIAHNKMLAKLASGMHKPAQQTVVPFSSVMGLLKPLPIKKMKQLGGKLGSSLQVDLGVNTVGDLLQFSEEKLQDHYGINTGTWLWNIARGISGDEVQGRLLPKSHGSGKSFPGPQALKTISSVEHWLNRLSEELSERLHSDLEQNKRIAHTLTLHARVYKSNESESHKKFPSKSCPLRYGAAKIQEDALNLFHAGLREYLGSHSAKAQGNLDNAWGITALSVSASKIVAIPSGTCSIMKYFHNQDQSVSSSKQLTDRFLDVVEPFSPSGSESYSGIISTELQSGFCDETGIKPSWSSTNQQGEGRIVKKDEEACQNIGGPTLDQSPFCSSSEQPEKFTEEALPPSSSGTKSCVVKEDAIQTVSPGKKASSHNATHGVKVQAQNKKRLKEKEKTSILTFFQSQSSCPSTEQRYPKITQETSVATGLQSIPPHGEIMLAEASRRNTCNLDHNAWSYNINEIDPAVVNELPPEIQEEVRAWLRPRKQANDNRVKGGSSIAHYFLPMKNTQ